MRVFFLLSFIAVFLTACQTPPRALSYDEQLMWAPTAVEADVSAWQAPAQLLLLPFLGDVSATERQQRTLYYDDGKGSTITVRLRPLPGGWEDMPERRAVDSHLLEQQQYYAQQAHLKGASSLNTYAEELGAVGLHQARVSTVAYTEQH